MSLLLFVPAALAGIPLQHVAIEATAVGPLADVIYTQTFHNDADTFVEATYVFPLPADAAVDGMTMEFGDRRVEGEVRERSAARKTYEAAIQRGQAAALTEQERPNVFTQTVGNLPPGADIRVTLHLVLPVHVADGAYELAFPLTVGPRFVPTGVADAERITPPVVRTDTGIRADLDVQIETGLAPAWVESPTHAVRVTTDEHGATVAFDALRLDRDAVVRWGLDVATPQAIALREGEHVLLLMEPPATTPRDAVVPRELIWVVDTSGSMQGAPLAMAKAAMHQVLDGMNARDSFLVLDFDETVSALASAPLPTTPENVARGRAFVDAFVGSGGTRMNSAIHTSLTLPHDPTRERYVCFLTDGFIGNEEQILSSIAQDLGDAHLYAFGLGSSTNRYLLDGMAEMGRGRATYVTLDEDPAGAVAAFLDTIDQPVLSDIEVDWGPHDEVYPQRVPDLIAGQPLFAVARVAAPVDRLTVTGRLAGEPFEVVVPVVDVDAPDAHALRSTWARQRIASLERDRAGGEQVESEILQTALEYGILSRYTAFVAVDRPRVNPTGTLTRADVPSDLPAGVNFEAAVSREWTPPGDPLLTLDAPADSRAVLALFPWGESAAMRWDSVRGRWYHRFLVPREVGDGDIQVLVYVVDRDGHPSRRVVTMHIDGDAPEIDVEVRVEDGRTWVTVHAEEPLRSVTAQPPGRADRRVRVDVDPDAGEVILELPGEWPEVEVAAHDLAMNTIVTRAVAREE